MLRHYCLCDFLLCNVRARMCVCLLAVCPGHLICTVVHQHDPPGHGAHCQRHERHHRRHGEYCGHSKASVLVLHRVETSLRGERIHSHRRARPQMFVQLGA